MGISLGLAYALGSFASHEEIVALCGEAAAHGKHISVHPRNEGVAADRGPREMIGIAARGARTAGALRLQIDHLKCSGKASWGSMPQALEKIEQARDEGLDIAFDVYPYTAGSRHLSGSLPAWMHAGGNEALVERLRDPRVPPAPARGVRRLAGGPRGRQPLRTQLRRYPRSPTSPPMQNRWAVGQRLDAVAEQRDQDPLEAAMDLIAEENGHVSVCLFSMSEDDMRLALAHPLGCVATDGLAYAPVRPAGEGQPAPALLRHLPAPAGPVRARGEADVAARGDPQVHLAPGLAPGAHRPRPAAGGLLRPTWWSSIRRRSPTPRPTRTRTSTRSASPA